MSSLFFWYACFTLADCNRWPYMGMSNNFGLLIALVNRVCDLTKINDTEKGVHRIELLDLGYDRYYRRVPYNWITIYPIQINEYEKCNF